MYHMLNQTSTEKLVVTMETATGAIILIEHEDRGLKPIDPNKIAKCDLCDKILGLYKNIEFTLDPETIRKAMRKGLLPEIKNLIPEEILSALSEREINVMFDNWKKLVAASETSWALCKECFDKVGKYK